MTGFDLLGGGFKTSAATLFVTLKPWDERDAHVETLIREFMGRSAAAIRDGLVLAFNPPAIQGLGTTGGFDCQLRSCQRHR